MPAPRPSGLALAALLLLCAAAGCNGGPEAEAPEPIPEIQRRPVDPTTVGSIGGVVRFQGTPPDVGNVPLGREAACARQHQGAVRSDAVLVDPSGGLGNVFVYAKQGCEATEFPPAEGEVVIDQVGCIYRPRVLGARVGQDITFVNSDPINHNVHTVPKRNRGTNFSMPTQGMRTTKRFKKPEVMVRTKCDIHPWMSAWIGVLRHPCFAVSGSDGSFDLTGLPPGDYELEAWHELFGTQTVAVTLEPSGTKRVELSFSK